MPAPSRIVALTAVALAALCLSALLAPATEKPTPNTLEPAAAELPAAIRRPLALALADEGRLLLVANRRRGSISLVDTRERRVVAEPVVAEQISSIALLPGERHLLVLDDQRHRLLVCDRDQSQLRQIAALRLPHSPTELAVSADGATAYVSCLWARRLAVVDLSRPAAPRLADVVRLPFAPRKLLLVRDGQRLIVADGFGSRIGIIDTAARRLVGSRELPGHNIRGLAVSADGRKLLVAHQTLNNLATTESNDVHWGVLLTNDLKWLVLDVFLDPEKPLYEGGHGYPTGDASHSAGEPCDVAVAPDGRVLVPLGGGSEVIVGRERDYTYERIDVGRRPTAAIVSPQGRWAYVANTFADSISVIDLQQNVCAAEISLGPAGKPTLADQGELLFYDAGLSLDGWFSCHGCHVDGHTSGELNDNLADGSYGAPKRIPSLLGVGLSGPWAWNGRRERIERQIAASIATTMRGEEPNEDQVLALMAYLNSLDPPPSLAAASGEVDVPSAARGRELFDNLGCARCHTPPRYTSWGAYDVGIHDKLGNQRFNPPSLLGVSQAGPYFHDGRAATLEEVFQKHRHQTDGPLSKQELADLVSFLKTL